MASGVNFGRQQYFGFDPRTIPGCQLWLDAADSSSITTSGASVTQWRDKSGNSRHANTGVSPTYSSNGVVFSGTSYLPIANASGLFVNTAFSIFMVEKVNSGAAGFFIGDDVVNSGGSTNSSLHIGYRTNSQVTFAFYGNDLEITGLSGNPTRLWGMNMPATANRNAFLNGSLVATLGNTSKLTAMTTLTLGRVFGGNYYQGTIYEIIAYVGELTSPQRQQVEGYLAWKWGLQANLPTAHPFRPNPTAMRNPTPLDFGPMLFWWDGLDLPNVACSSGTPGAGGRVSSWTDRINGFALTVPTNFIGPTSESNGIRFSNVSSLVTSGVSQVLQYSNATSTTLTQNNTLIVAHAPNRFDGLRSAFAIVAPLAFNTNPTIFMDAQTGTAGNIVGAYNGSTAWITLQEAAAVITTSNAGRVDSLLSAPSNFAWTNGTENSYSINNIGRGTAAPGTAVFGGAIIGGTSTLNGNREYDGTVYEVLFYNSNLSSNAIRQAEAYLAWKWNFVGSIVNTHPFKTIPTSSPLFVPTFLSNCALWLDAADSSTVTLSGSSVTTWNDKSGSNYNFTNNSTVTPFSLNNFPTYTSSGLNGLPVVTFSSVQTLGSSDVFAGNQNQSFTIFCVGTVGSINRGRDGYGNGWSISILPANTTDSYVLTTNGTAQYNITRSTASIPVYATSVTQTTSTLVIVRINGSETGRSTFANYTLRSSTIGHFIGFGGYVGEMIIYNRSLLNAEFQQIEGYLAWKWGLRTSLPITHPYYRFRP